MIAALLCSLPDSYSTLVTTLEGRAEDDLTVDYIRGKLIQNILQNLPPPCHYSTVHPQVAAGGTASQDAG